MADLCERLAAADATEAAALLIATLPRLLGVDRVTMSLDSAARMLDSRPAPADDSGDSMLGARAKVTRPLWLLSSPDTRQIHVAQALVAAGDARFGWIRIERTAKRLDPQEQASLRLVALTLGQRLALLAAGAARGPHAAGAVEDEPPHAERPRWDRFLASIAHEVKTPLTCVSGHAQLVRRALRAAHGPDGKLKRGAAARVIDAVDRHLPPLERQVARIERLIRDAQDLAEADAGALTIQLADCDIVRLARRALASAAICDTCDVRLDAPDALTLRCDARRVEDMLRRLVEYAARQVCQEGALVMRVREDAHAGSRCAGVAISSVADIARRDADGSRIPALDIGLALDEAVTRLHGGTLRRTVRSGGVQVELLLPVAGASDGTV